MKEELLVPLNMTSTVILDERHSETLAVPYIVDKTGKLYKSDERLYRYIMHINYSNQTLRKLLVQIWLLAIYMTGLEKKPISCNQINQVEGHSNTK